MKNKSRRLNIPKIIIILGILLLLVIILKVLSLKQPPIDINNINLIIDNENVTNKIKDNIKIDNDSVYMNIEDVKQFIDKSIYKENDTIIMISDKKLSTLKLDEKIININGSKQNISNTAFEENTNIYLPISELESAYDIEVNYYNNTNIVTIDYKYKKLEKAFVNKKIYIKQENKIFSKKLEKVKKGNWVIFINKDNKWSKVRTQDGIIGYIKNNKLTNFIVERGELNIEDNDISKTDKCLEYDISNKDILNFEKRLNIIKMIWKKAIEGDYQAVRIKSNNQNNIERFRIEVKPFLKECGIKVEIN